MLFFLSACASNGGAGQKNGSIFEIKKSQITHDHIKCFVCESGLIPSNVKQMRIYQYQSEYCKSIFKTRRFELQTTKNIDDFLFRYEEFDRSVVFTISKNGGNLKEISGKELYKTIAFNKDIKHCIQGEI